MKTSEVTNCYKMSAFTFCFYKVAFMNMVARSEGNINEDLMRRVPSSNVEHCFKRNA